MVEGDLVADGGKKQAKTTLDGQQQTRSTSANNNFKLH